MKKSAKYLESIIAQEKAIDELYEEIERSKLKLRQDALNFLRDLEGNERHWLASQVYWLHGDYIHASTVKEVYPSKGHQVPHEIKAFGVELPCYSCGNQTKYLFKSRSEHNHIMADLKKHLKGKFSYYRVMCDECQVIEDKRKEQQRIEYSNRRQEILETRERLKSMPYSEYLQTDHWQKTRKEAMRRAGFRCQTCNTKGVLHVHHRTYANRGHESMGDLTVLCKDCHDTFHKNRELDKS